MKKERHEEKNQVNMNRNRGITKEDELRMRTREVRMKKGGEQVEKEQQEERVWDGKNDKERM